MGIEEEEAGRRFLDILRKAHRKEKEQEENEARTSEYRTELWNSTDTYDLSTTNNTDNNSSGEIDESLHSDKKVLRHNLEKLISLYLTKLREDNINDEEEEFNHIRNRREVIHNNEKQRRKKLEKSDCKQMRRRISSLDRFEIEKSLQNYTNTQFNIRKLLNYRYINIQLLTNFRSGPLLFSNTSQHCRCSGKNHCSFIFGNDHPYALFWTSGVVHIKYICIDGM